MTLLEARSSFGDPLKGQLGIGPSGGVDAGSSTPRIMIEEARSWSTLPFTAKGEFVIDRTRARRFNRQPPWMDEVIARIIYLTKLAHGWDGESAPPVSPKVAAFVVREVLSRCPTRLPKPFATLSFTGGLQLDWVAQFPEVELLCETPPQLSLYIVHQDGRDEIHELDLSNLAPLYQVLDRLSEDHRDGRL